MRVLLKLIILSILLAGNAYAITAENIIAYPVPFNPVNGDVKYLTINDLQGTSSDADIISIEIFDVNGHKVFARTYDSWTDGSDNIVIWNGRNTKGELVKPGLYILRIQAEHSKGDGFGVKRIRILVRY